MPHPTHPLSPALLWFRLFVRPPFRRAWHARLRIGRPTSGLRFLLFLLLSPLPAGRRTRRSPTRPIAGSPLPKPRTSVARMPMARNAHPAPPPSCASRWTAVPHRPGSCRTPRTVPPPRGPGAAARPVRAAAGLPLALERRGAVHAGRCHRAMGERWTPHFTSPPLATGGMLWRMRIPSSGSRFLATRPFSHGRLRPSLALALALARHHQPRSALQPFPGRRPSPSLVLCVSTKTSPGLRKGKIAFQDTLFRPLIIAFHDAASPILQFAPISF